MAETLDKRKIKVLVVDNEESLRKSLAEVLKLEGYDIVTAGDGYSAIDMVKNDYFDIALIDIKMPGINGVEAFEKIKKISPSTIVVMMTAYTVEDLVAQATNEGAYACIYKPFDVEEIVKLIQKSLENPLILVVDDQPGVREALSAGLTELGCRVMKAESGEEAIRALEKKPTDVLLLDVEMPKMDGVQTLEHIREVIHGEDMPITIMTSGFEVTDKVKQAFKLGAAEFLPKPLDVEVLKEKIDGLLKKKLQKLSGLEQPKVLVVDDEIAFLNMVSDTLQHAGFDVETATNGEEAIDYIVRNHARVILLDIRLPGIDGFEVYRRVKEIKPEVGIIMMSAYTQEEAIIKTLGQGKYVYLHKPFDMKKLLDLVRNMIPLSEKH